MENTYRLSYTAEDINRRLGNMDNVLMTIEQELTQEQQLQVQANLGITSENISSLTYTKLYDKVEITADDVAAAGEEGITCVTIGSDSINLEKYNEILLKIYIPVSETINTAIGTISIYATETAQFSEYDYCLLLATQSSTISTACVMQHDCNNIFAIQAVWTGDAFLYGQVTKNGYSNSFGYAGVVNGWTSQYHAFKKSEKKYFHITDYRNGFKFPAGTWVEVYGR